MKPATTISLMKLQFKEAGASEALIEKMINFTLYMQAHKREFLITCVYRSPAVQNEMYEHGRSKPGPIITNARGGQSKHNRQDGKQQASDAFDVCPSFNNLPDWTKTGPALTTWETMGDAANQAGLEWGRHWQSLGYDWCHFEIYEAPTIKQELPT